MKDGRRERTGYRISGLRAITEGGGGRGKQRRWMMCSIRKGKGVGSILPPRLPPLPKRGLLFGE